jgi:DNA-binding response OmpR family regulator
MAMKKHIVLIEDDPGLREIIQIILEGANYRVTALPAIDTVEELLDLCPHCFVIDEQLPIVNGHIICIILSSKPQTKGIPVILMSAGEGLEGYASLCEAKAYLKKPFDPASILDLVDDVIADNQQQQA